MSADDAPAELKKADGTRMAGLSSVERVRERAAECRARAEHPILQADAAEWLQLADTWDQLADSMEASAHRDATEPRAAARPDSRMTGEE